MASPSLPRRPHPFLAGSVPARRNHRAVRLSRARRRLDRSTARNGGGGHWRIYAVLAGLFAVAIVGLPIVTAGGVATAAIVAVNSISEGLPDPRSLETLSFAEPTKVYDRTGKIQLATFQKEQRRVVGFKELPRLVLDATTTAEDRTFWSNGGFDGPAILSAIAKSAAGDGDRGASTITQQLVRARLLPPEAVAPGADRYRRKLMEIIQSWRLTSEFPGQAGKEKIITAYLNENFYGHGAYGIAAAATIYFGVTDLKKLTPAQAALLAGLPQSPTFYDPYQFARKDSKGRLVVPQSTAIVQRRNYILNAMNTGRWTRLSPADLAKAVKEPVILAGDRPSLYLAPHFTWAVRAQLDNILGDDDAVTTGGYRVITTLDWRAQQLAEKWVTAAVVLPNLAEEPFENALDAMKIKAADRKWIRNLRGKDLHNGALTAIDYKTGDVLAYVGSAGYYLDDMASEKFDPKFDVLSSGYRQPGSAWKPILYSTAFDTHTLTPGSLLLDITTKFSAKWIPTDADQMDRGPVLVRKALQYSLNLPAIRALERVGSSDVADQAAEYGISFQGGKLTYLQAGLAGALGTVEVRPLDLTSAYGALGNGGRLNEPQMILKVIGPDGQIVYQRPKLTPVQVVSRQAAFLTSDILKGNTDPDQNPIWSAVLSVTNGPDGERRPAAVKTGTTNDTRDLATYGYLAPDPDRPSIAVGVWMGNSDHSYPRAKDAPISLTGPGPLWQAFVRDYTNHVPIVDFEPPTGVVRATIDAWTGGAPGRWTRETTQEWFIKGTEPGATGEVDPPGLLYSNSCGFWSVDALKAELGPSTWDASVANWMARAQRGPGVEGDLGSTTAYFWGRTGWGGTIGTCDGASGLGAPRPYVRRPTRPSPSPGSSPGSSPGASFDPNAPVVGLAPPAVAPQPTVETTPAPKPTKPPKPGKPDRPGKP